ncbi:MAG TPA: hypothetical protein VGO07_02785 [Candidatus Saccharimonadales bacterium]|jgi:hypothetical protein|nr:hypothetical protein [Candidatus Saccharimonadales bacterium]
MSEETVQPQPPVSEPANDLKFDPDDHGAPSPFLSPEEEEIKKAEEHAVTWTASEYIAHHKSPAWYGIVAAATVALAAATFLITRDKISAVTIIIVGILFCIAAARKPRVLTYKLDKDGLTMGQRFHPYGEFKSFSIMREGAFANVDLLPLKRFMPMTSVYFSPENEDNVVDTLSEHIPFEERSHAIIDRFMRNVRF